MKFPGFLIVGIIILVGLVFLFNSKSQPAKTYSIPVKIVADMTVGMKPDTFDPAIFTIQKNTKVIFKNLDTKGRWPASDLHPSHEIYPEFDPQENIDPGKEWSFVFEKVGVWKFHDHRDPSLRGTVTVVE